MKGHESMLAAKVINENLRIRKYSTLLSPLRSEWDYAVELEPSTGIWTLMSILFIVTKVPHSRAEVRQLQSK